jgi:hypothetical protein
MVFLLNDGLMSASGSTSNDFQAISRSKQWLLTLEIFIFRDKAIGCLLANEI